MKKEILFILLFLMPLSVFAQDNEWENKLTGDWGGLRSTLSENGIDISSQYLFAPWINLHGGANTSDSLELQHNIQTFFDLDTKRAGLWDDGQFHLYLHGNFGRGMSGTHAPSAINMYGPDAPGAGDFIQVEELWYQHTIGEIVRLRFGRIDASADFRRANFSGGYFNDAFGPGPGSMNPFPHHPITALGVELLLQPNDTYYVNLGLFDGQGERDVWDTAFDGDERAYGIIEGGIHLTLPIFGQDLPGTYRIGVWHDWNERQKIGGLPNSIYNNGGAGVYLACDQMFYKENPGDDDEQGFGAFLKLEFAPQNRYFVDMCLGAGLRYQGLIPERDNDFIGLGFLYADICDNLANVSNEYGIETFYRFQITPWFHIQPDMQFIANPNGTGRDALVFGIQAGLVF